MSAGLKSLLGIYLRGLAMGSADIVPGVSGGTVALITGIYDRLLTAIAAADITAVKLLFCGQFKQLWQRFDGAFLATLLAGIGTAVVVLAGVIHWLLENYPLPLWSFFFGLVLASAVYLFVEEVPGKRTRELPFVVLGVVVAAAIGLAPATEFIDGPVGFFLAGSLAICAMILPGISGSFILLLIGMYGPVITAINERDLVTLLIFAGGCVTGLLAFSNVLHWVLEHLRRPTMAVLAGFLLGSLIILWPWQDVVASIIDRHGELRVVQTQPISPMAYAAIHGTSQWLSCSLAAIAGAMLVLLSHRAGQRRANGGGLPERQR